MFKKVLLILVFLLPGICSASLNLYGVKLTTVGVQDALNSKEYFWVQFDSPAPTNTLPSCHTGPANRVIWDLNVPASQAALSLALTAYTTGKKVDVNAYDTCIDGMSTVRNLYFSLTQ